jgi:hypothetical protein
MAYTHTKTNNNTIALIYKTVAPYKKNSGAAEGYAVPVPYVTSVVLLLCSSFHGFIPTDSSFKNKTIVHCL